MVMVNISGLMEKFVIKIYKIKDFGRMESNMEKEKLLIMMEV